MIIIIGSGLAGYMLAKEFRKLDQSTALTIVTQNAGDFYSKPLLSTALTGNKYPAELVIANSASMAEQLNAKIYTQTSVQEINPKNKTITFNDEIFNYDKLILACGSEPLNVSLLGDAVSEIFSINNLEDYSLFRNWLTPEKKRIAILGSGLVGCEFANDLINTGHDVDIISLDAYPLAKFVPEPVGRIIQKVFAAKGVRWYLSSPAVSVDKISVGYAVQLHSGNTIVTNGVLSAVGLRANTDLAKNAGLVVQRGIVVDHNLQTSDPNIYALGDCAEVLGEVKQYVAPLLHCARALAGFLAGGSDAVKYPVMPVVIKTSICPIVVCTASSDVNGEWRYSGEGNNLRALFYDASEQLRGFVLVGECVQEKMNLLKICTY